MGQEQTVSGNRSIVYGFEKKKKVYPYLIPFKNKIPSRIKAWMWKVKLKRIFKNV